MEITFATQHPFPGGITFPSTVPLSAYELWVALTSHLLRDPHPGLAAEVTMTGARSVRSLHTLMGVMGPSQEEVFLAH